MSTVSCPLSVIIKANRSPFGLNINLLNTDDFKFGICNTLLSSSDHIDT